MSSFRYDRAKEMLGIAGAGGDLSGLTLKVALCTSTYTPNQGTHRYFSDLTNEVSGTGYVAGGKTLTTVAKTLDTTNHYWKITADNVVWSTATLTARYAIVYISTGTAGTSQLICLIDFGSDKSVTGLDFDLNWDSTTGVFYIS